jgi:hypothetical protein
MSGGSYIPKNGISGNLPRLPSGHKRFTENPTSQEPTVPSYSTASHRLPQLPQIQVLGPSGRGTERIYSEIRAAFLEAP